MYYWPGRSALTQGIVRGGALSRFGDKTGAVRRARGGAFSSVSGERTSARARAQVSILALQNWVTCNTLRVHIDEKTLTSNNLRSMFRLRGCTSRRENVPPVVRDISQRRGRRDAWITPETGSV